MHLCIGILSSPTLTRFRRLVLRCRLSSRFIFFTYIFTPNIVYLIMNTCVRTTLILLWQGDTKQNLHAKLLLFGLGIEWLLFYLEWFWSSASYGQLQYSNSNKHEDLIIFQGNITFLFGFPLISVNKKKNHNLSDNCMKPFKYVANVGFHVFCLFCLFCPSELRGEISNKNIPKA